MTTIVEALESGATRGEATFCHFRQAGGATAISRGDLLRGAQRYANLFHDSGVRPGEVVLIILRHSPDLLYSFLGAMLAGALPSFMPYPTSKQEPTLYWAGHRTLFERIGAGAVLVDRQDLDALRRNTSSLSLHVLTPDQARDAPPDFAAVATTPDRAAFLQHSSGTTALKKGVILSHRAVIGHVTAYASALGLGPGDRIVSWLPLYHDMGLIACFMLPFLTGVPVVMLDPFEWVANPRMLFDAVKQHRGTLCWLPNFAFHHLCRTIRPGPELDLSSMRAWIDCSEPCRLETLELFERTFAGAGVKAEHLQVSYGMAETVLAISQTLPGRRPRALAVDPDAWRAAGRATPAAADAPRLSVLSTGPAIPGTEIRIVDVAGEPVPDDRVGEICVASADLFSGYFRLEDETRGRFQGRWYHTGDLGFLHDGELYVTGRKHDLIIVHGRNYHAHELEYVVNQVPGVHPGRNVATGWFRSEIGSEDVVIIAEVEPGADRARLARDMKQALLDQAGLVVYDVHLVGPGWLVKTTSGKISRSANLDKYRAARAGGTRS